MHASMLIRKDYGVWISLTSIVELVFLAGQFFPYINQRLEYLWHVHSKYELWNVMSFHERHVRLQSIGFEIVYIKRLAVSPQQSITPQWCHLLPPQDSQWLKT